MYKLCIIDDDEYCQEVLTDALDSNDYEIVTANDGEAGLEMITLDPPDLVLLDIDMPKMDGVQVLRILKGQETTKHIPVIMVTALNTESQIASCLDNGAVDHIVKPLSNVVVRARVRAALRSYDAISSANEWSPDRGKVFAFIGAKGGVGNTTVAVNVALDMVKRGHSTNICELRPDFGSLGSQLGVSRERDLRQVLDLDSDLISAQRIEEAQCKHQSGLQALLGPQDAETLVDITSDQAEALVTAMAGSVEYTILDLPHTPFVSTEISLRRADFIVLTLELEPASMMGAQNILARLAAQGIGSNCVGTVVVNRTWASSPITLNTVRSSLNCLLIGVIPADPDACIHASRTGTPVVMSLPDSGVAGAYSSLANRLIGEQLGVLEF